MDVRAIRRVAHNEEKKISAFIEIIGECKNNSNPLVFIGRPKSHLDSLYAPEELVSSDDGQGSILPFGFSTKCTMALRQK